MNIKKKISNFLQQYCGSIFGKAINIGELLSGIIIATLMWLFFWWLYNKGG